MRFTVKQYADFGATQESQPILYESDSINDIKNYLKEYFRYETYFNAVYFIDNTLNKSGYVGRELTINCGESLESFCDLPEATIEYDNNNELIRIKEILTQYCFVANTPTGPIITITIPMASAYQEFTSVANWLNND